ncbi:BatD family protein [Sulfurimonas sp. SAG-AH-194-L11]|nr:hypothetical protein [Sulfurimonas sp. SAG-AH-194-L11]MDF1876731.1 BatD family protein [Sulfurimonas sp. SAG-AH-194-L11]
MFYKISIILFLHLLVSSLYASQIIQAPKGYSFTAELTDTSILLGETTQLKLTYTYSDLEDYEITEPEFTGMLVKELGSKDFKKEDSTRVEEIYYSITPQSEGNFTLKGLRVETQIIDGLYKNFDNRSKYTKRFIVKASELNLEVKKLPDNITAIGEYRLTASVDKRSVLAGEVVTLRISLYGDGNIQNLDSIVPKIQDATAYLLYTTSSKRQHLQTKAYALISEKDYTIPSFELLYFDKRDSLVKKTATELIKIDIKGYTHKKEKIVSDNNNYIYFFIASFITLTIILIYQIKKRRVKQKTSLIKKLKSARKKDEFYKKVVVYLGRDKNLDALIYKLEDEHLPNFKTIKKEIIKELVKLGLHERDDLLFTTQYTL